MGCRRLDNAPSLQAKASHTSLKPNCTALRGTTATTPLNMQLALQDVSRLYDIFIDYVLRFLAMVIHGPKNAPYDLDLGPVPVSDWYHKEYFNIVKTEVMADGPPPASDNNLIASKASPDCIHSENCEMSLLSSPSYPNTLLGTSVANVAKFYFQTGKTHLLRLINPGAEAIIHFTIDNHNMTIVANDFVPVQPYTTNVVTLGASLFHAQDDKTDANSLAI